MADDPNISAGLRKNLNRYGNRFGMDMNPATPVPQSPEPNFQLFDNPPSVADVVNHGVRANPMANFQPSSVGGIYKAIGPDGSVTFTDRPGGSFVPNDAPARNPGVRQYVDNALTPRGVQTPYGEMGTGAGNFSAASIPGTGAKFRYQPLMPDDKEGLDAGTMKGLTPGTTAWINANNAHVDPLSSPEAAMQYARNNAANTAARRGEGRFNYGVYDPSGYRQSIMPTGMGGFGMGGFGGMNPLDAMEKLANIREKEQVGAAATSKATTQEENAVNDAIQKLAGDPAIQERAAKAGTDAQTLATILYAKRNPESSLAEANARSALAGHLTKQMNDQYGARDWLIHALHLPNDSAPEPTPSGNAPELPYSTGTAWGRRALIAPPRDREGNPVSQSDPRATNNYSFVSPFWGRGGAEILGDPEVGPYANNLFARDRERYNSRLKEIGAAARKNAEK